MRNPICIPLCIPLCIPICIPLSTPICIPLRIPLRVPICTIVALACVGFIACTRAPAGDTPAQGAAPASSATAGAPSISIGAIHALLTENAPGVDVSLQQRGADIAIELRGHSDPTTALALLASLPARLPGVRATAMRFDASAWSATLLTSASGEPAPLDVTSLPIALSAATPVFTGGKALLATGAVELTGARVKFQGELARGRSIADAGDVIASGFSLTKVEHGPPFVLEIVKR